MWTASATDGTIITDGGSVNFPVLDVGADTGGTGQKEVTLLRMRGWIAVHLIEVTAGNRILMGGASVHDTEDSTAPPDWRNVNNYTDEDILWTFGGAMRVHSALTTEIESKTTWHFPVDIRAKRKLKAGQIVLISMTYDGPATTTANVVGAVRALSKLR